ncbi:MAG: hypothetical protein HY308_17280 [Gammaproteobacteria bacterium]|nr:hypothetical protein [Gammaproteobacteria bacterium]
MKLAITRRSAFRVTVHVKLEPAQAPLQPLNTEPEAAVAVNVTAVLFAYDALHAVPQSMPAGAELTVPDPEPDLVSVNRYVSAGGGVGSDGVSDDPPPPQPAVNSTGQKAAMPTKQRKKFMILPLIEKRTCGCVSFAS